MTTENALLGFTQPNARWPEQAGREMQRVRRALGTSCRAVHHVGSTSVAGPPAVPVPVMDLMAELDDAGLHGMARLRLLAHGFVDMPGPSHCVAFAVEDALSGCRVVELLLYPFGHEDVRVTVAFFAYLRVQPDVAVAYSTMKLHARSKHGAGTSGYAAEKWAWMQQHAQPSRDLPLHPVA